MKRAGWIVMLAVGCGAPAVMVPRPTSDATWVKVLSVGPQTPNGAAWVGRTCGLVAEPDPGSTPGTSNIWLSCLDGSDAKLTDATYEKVPAPAEVMPGVSSYVQILAIDRSDENYDRRANLVGQKCTVQGTVEAAATPFYYRVVMACDEGERIAFDAVQYKVTDKAAPPVAPTTSSGDESSPSSMPGKLEGAGDEDGPHREHGDDRASEDTPHSGAASSSNSSLCYDYSWNNNKTGKKCFANRAGYCASVCSESNELAKRDCASSCSAK